MAEHHVEYAYAAAEGMAVRNAPAAPLVGLGRGVARRLPIIPGEQFDFEGWGDHASVR